MAFANELNTSVELAPNKQPSEAILQVIGDTHGPGARAPQIRSLHSINVEREITDDMTITSFPNGIKYGRGVGAYEVVPPLGGRVIDDGHGGTAILDAHNKQVGDLDNHKVMHVQSKLGDYTETANGQVFFTPSGHTSYLRSLHHNGIVNRSSWETYGVSTDDHMTRFPNGIEYNPRTNNVQVPAEHSFLFQEDKVWNVNTNSIDRIGTDLDGKLLYRVDRTGIHVPSPDGTLSQSHHGTLRFNRPTSALPARSLHTRIAKGSLNRDIKPEVDCYKSDNPLCGLDDGPFQF